MIKQSNVFSSNADYIPTRKNNSYPEFLSNVQLFIVIMDCI